MSVSLLNKTGNKLQSLARHKWVRVVILPIWVFIGFMAADYILQIIAYVLVSMGVSFVGIDTTILNAVLAALIYALTIAIVIGLPWLVHRSITTREDLGMVRLPSGMDILLAPAGFIVYFLASAALVYVASQVIPGFAIDQTQQTGFNHLTFYYEYVLAFITLIIVAPIAEETLFRGYLYGKLRKTLPAWVAMLITSILFGLVHGQWNVGVDVFALSMVLCCLREVTGNIWAGMLLHMIKNGIAFYILFANPNF